MKFVAAISTCRDITVPDHIKEVSTGSRILPHR